MMTTKQVWKPSFSLVMLLVSFGLGSSVTQVYYITPSSSDPCPAEPCLTLSQFANNSNNYVNSNTTLIFLSGKHRLELELLVDNTTELSILFNSMNSTDTHAVIVCQLHTMFVVENVDVVHISGLTFVGCAENGVKHVHQFVLEDSTFVGQNEVNGTALVIVETSASLIRSTFSFNIADKHYNVGCDAYDQYLIKARAGGAIVSTKSSVTIIECVFEGNSAEAGGAIFSTLQASITIINSTFERNHAAHPSSSCTIIGGALHFESGNTIVIYGSHFINNSAQWWSGGGVVASRYVDCITISHSKFIDNNAQSGGVVHAIGADMYITNSDFISNSASKGGVVYTYKLLSSSLLIVQSHFTNNSAVTKGGIVYAHRRSVQSIATGIIHCEFINNSAKEGGILYLNADIINMTITHSKFINNSVLEGGGVVQIPIEPSTGELPTSNIVIAHSKFLSNGAAYHAGGVIFIAQPASITITQCHFNDNYSGVEGGVMAFGLSGSISITFSKFINNIAGTGGVVSDLGGNIFISHSEFINNTALTRYGGVFHGEDVKVITVIDSCFIGNSAPAGGVIFANGDNRDTDTVTIAHSKFINNTAKQDGGVLHTQYYYNTAISYSEFINNSVLHDGGVLWSQFSSNEHVEITGNRFLSNRALNNGGAIDMFQGTLTVSNSSFLYNSVANDGGVLHLDQTNARIIAAVFKSNKADGNGGTMQITEGKKLAINDSNFVNNSAGHNGGVVSSQHDIMIIYGGTFDGNSAGHDGGVYSLLQVNTAVNGCSHDHNSAGHDGGVFQIYQGALNFSENTFRSNTAINDGGAILAYQSTTDISACHFSNNMAMNDGGAVSAYQHSLSISEDSGFIYNTAGNDGGAIHAYELHTTITQNSYDSNKAGNRGGAWFVYQGSLTVTLSILSHSEATEGGVIYADQGNIRIENTSSVRNKANEGGVLHIDQSSATIKHSAFNQNLASSNGGAWFIDNSSVLLQGVSATSNMANFGGTVYASKSELHSFDFLLIHNNTASLGVVYLLSSVVHFNGKTVFSTNSGSCLVFNSVATFNGHTSFINFSEPTVMESSNDTIQLQEGGALTTFKSNVIFYGISNLVYNHAEYGGAIHATESKLYVQGVTTIANNTAMATGGGVYLDMSELYCQGDSTLNFLHNFATEKGGGVHAISSTINVIGNFSYGMDSNVTIDTALYSGSRLYFIENEAGKGGGLCLEMTAKLYILKSMPYSEPFHIVNFIANSADYGGAIYVSDDSNLGLCDPNYRSHFKAKECFVQTLAVYGSMPSNTDEQHMNIKNIYFSRNSALISGSGLFGGLIDRCRVHHFTEHRKLLLTMVSSYQQYHSQDALVNGVSYIRKISNIDLSDIGSQPVQLCFCKNDKSVCDYQPGPIRVTKGKRFSVELVAVDQVNHPVNATIYSSLYKTGGGFMKDQSIQNTTKSCTELNFNLFSPSDREELIMYAEGPCMYSPQSQRRLNIQFTACDSCPIGFEKHVDETTVCDCICDSKLELYITNCNQSTELLERAGSFWITYINTSDSATSGYLIYPHCPFNYCQPPTSKVEINLNIPYGDDVQCADGRSGTLCGSCQSNLSLSLGSSRCILCPSQWPLVLVAILVAAFIAGIVLVALLLMLNLTVAVGTLNGIVFYANIVAANSSTFLPFSEPNFVTVFISWINLELGFDTCFFPGMDAYWKTLLQLAFPAYVIFLVVVVITISEHSTRFARLVARKNPVATLATLILLSYTKFLNTIIASLSFATLDYPDGSYHVVWLPDATVAYLGGKHIVLFIIAVVILLAGAVYTALLVSWQWLLQYQNKKIFMWTKHQKLCHFIEPYHAPYTFKQRYWTGLLLLVRVILYILSAVNVTGDPRVALVSTIIVVGCLPIMKGVLERKIYKTWLVDITEMLTYFNIIAFTTLTLYTFDRSKNQTAVAYTSVMITFALLLAIIAFHVTRYAGLLSVVQKTTAKFLACRKKHHARCVQTGTPIDEDNLNQPLITQSVIEISSPCVELEPVLKDKEITPTGSNQDNVENGNATAHVDEEAFKSPSNVTVEASQLELGTLSTRTETLHEFDRESLSDHQVISSTPPVQW